MTASKPDTASGDIGRDGSQGTRSSSAPTCPLCGRVNRAMLAPALFKEVTSAEPTRPEDPLTRMRAMDRFTMGVTLADSLEGAPLFLSCETYAFSDRKSWDRTLARAQTRLGLED